MESNIKFFDMEVKTEYKRLTKDLFIFLAKKN